MGFDVVRDALELLSLLVFTLTNIFPSQTGRLSETTHRKPPWLGFEVFILRSVYLLSHTMVIFHICLNKQTHL